MNLSVTNIIKRIVLFVVLTHINQYCLAPRSSNSFFKKAKDFVIPSKDKSKAGNIVGVSATVLAIVGTYMLGKTAITLYKDSKRENKDKDPKDINKGAHAENALEIAILVPESVKFPTFVTVSEEGKMGPPFIIGEDLSKEMDAGDKYNKNLVAKNRKVGEAVIDYKPYTPTLTPSSKNSPNYVLTFPNEATKEDFLNLVKSIRIHKISIFLKKDKANGIVNDILKEKPADDKMSKTEYLNLQIKAKSKNKAYRYEYEQFFDNIIQDLWQQYWDKVVVVKLIPEEEQQNILNNKLLLNDYETRENWLSSSNSKLINEIKEDCDTNQQPLLKFLNNINDLASEYRITKMQPYESVLKDLIKKGPSTRNSHLPDGILTHWMKTKK